MKVVIVAETYSTFEDAWETAEAMKETLARLYASRTFSLVSVEVAEDRPFVIRIPR